MDDGVEQRMDSLALNSGAAEDGNENALDSGPPQGFPELLLPQVIPFEVTDQQRFIRLHDLFDHGLPVLLVFLQILVRHGHLFGGFQPTASIPIGVYQSPATNEVDNAPEGILFP